VEEVTVQVEQDRKLDIAMLDLIRSRVIFVSRRVDVRLLGITWTYRSVFCEKQT
jgi:hypothetical protein